MLIGASAVVVLHLMVIAHRRATHTGDFDLSREFGRRFLAGERLYAGGLHYPYMPSAALYFSPLALVAPGVGLAMRYAVALICLWVTLRTLERMVTAQGTMVHALTLLLASHYVIRDLDDGGPHLILLAMLVGGIFCARSGRDKLAGMWFGLATALKAPAGLFVPFFLWKRQWRLALWSAVAAACWIVLPAVWMGPASWWTHQKEWTRVAVASALSNPVEGAADSEQRAQNQALRPALLHYFAADPEGPGLAAANLTATLAALTLAAAFCWWTRTPYTARTDPRWLLECSAVLILTLLFSPVTWVQHLVFMVPALFLIVAEGRSVRRLGTPATVAMSLYLTFALLLNREFVGREAYLLMLRYGVHTVCVFLVLAVIVFRQPTERI